MRRVSVVGVSGAGKTTFAAALADRLGVAHVELDAIFHQPGWTSLPAEEFRHRVGEVADGDGWVACGNYSAVQELLWARADAVIWLDYPRWITTPRIVRRSWQRVRSGEELWNGNRERWRQLLSLRPERSVVVWSITRHRRVRQRYEAASADPRWSAIELHRVRHPREAEALLASLPLREPPPAAPAGGPR